MLFVFTTIAYSFHFFYSQRQLLFSHQSVKFPIKMLKYKFIPSDRRQSSPRSFTPEPSPRHQHYKVKEQLRSPETNFVRNGSFRGSAHSLASSSGSGYSTVRHKKGKAPAPPISSIYGSINELYPSRSSTPSHSQVGFSSFCNFFDFFLILNVF